MRTTRFFLSLLNFVTRFCNIAPSISISHFEINRSIMMTYHDDSDKHIQKLLRFFRDIFARRGRAHPNLLYVLGWLMPREGVLQVVMEKARTDLLTALRRGMSPRRRLKVAADAALGLKAMHDVGYVYQDLKPENILVSATTDYEFFLILFSSEKRLPYKKSCGRPRLALRRFCFQARSGSFRYN